MINILPFLVALLIGHMVFILIYKKNTYPNLINICISFILGMGICALTVFSQILIYDRFNIYILHLIVLIELLILLLLIKKESISTYKDNKLPTFVLFLLLIPFSIYFIKMIQINFYGHWDAWSLWNFRAKFLALSHENWKLGYEYTVQSKHPWLFSYWILFTWSFSGEINQITPCINTFILGMIIPILIFFGLIEWGVSLIGAVLATLYYISIPFISMHGTSQYADILVTCLIVMISIVYFRLLKSTKSSDQLIFGLLISLLLLIKDEGLLVGLIFIALYFVKLKAISKNIFYPIIVGALLLILMKFWMIPAESGENKINFGNLLILERYIDVIKYFKYVLSHIVYGGICYIVLFSLSYCLICWKNIKSNIRDLIYFYGFFMLSFLVLYVLVKDHLSWRLWTTAFRLQYLLTPITIMIFFSLYFIRNEKVAKS